MKHLITLLVLVLLAGIADGTKETLQFHYNASIFAMRTNQQYWNPKISWLNKYKDITIDKTPKFFGASTFLVWTTDAYHLFKSIYYLCFRLAVLLAIMITYKYYFRKRLLDLALIYSALFLIQAAGFHLMYSWLLLQNPISVLLEALHQAYFCATIK